MNNPRLCVRARLSVVPNYAHLTWALAPERIHAGTKALHNGSLAARLKPCPDTSQMPLFFAGFEAVAHPGLCQDVLRRGGVLWFEFLAEMIHEDAKILGLFCAVATPDGGEQRAMG